MKKKELIYSPPEVSIISLGSTLNILQSSFSTGSQGGDWGFEDGFSEFEDDPTLGSKDWGLGTVGNDTM